MQFHVEVKVEKFEWNCTFAIINHLMLAVLIGTGNFQQYSVSSRLI